VQIIEREILPQIKNHLFEKEVTVITGARQTGKTTLINQLKDWLIEHKKAKPSQIKLFNLDLISDLEAIHDQKDFLKFIKEELKRERFLFIFIDEIQRIENPGKFLKGIYDLNLPVKFVATGSSSLEIKSKVFESLTGRKRVFHIWPFSFNEYLRFKEPWLINLLIKRELSRINKEKILEHLFDFLIYGGYPRVVTAKNNYEKIKFLEEIYSSYVEKDVVGFLKIKNPLTFTKLVSLLGSQSCGLLNIHEISNTLKINVRTIENYLNTLENTFVIKLVRPYFTNKRKELTKMPKLYFIDNGLRNFSVKYFSEFKNNRDRGILLENFVFSTLIKFWGGEIHYWRTKDKNEVDFILTDFYGNIIPLEVKSSELNRPETGSGLHTFIEKYSPRKSYVVNLLFEGKSKIKGTLLQFLLPFRIPSWL